MFQVYYSLNLMQICRSFVFVLFPKIRVIKRPPAYWYFVWFQIHIVQSVFNKGYDYEKTNVLEINNKHQVFCYK